MTNTEKRGIPNFDIVSNFKFRISCLSVILVLVFYGCSRPKTGALQVIQGQTMGTFFTIKYIRRGAQAPVLTDKEIEAGIHQVLLEVNRQMSTYLAGSEISNFNRCRERDWFPVSAELAWVVDQAIKVSQMSGGAFDITVGPLVNLWGFGPDKKPEKIPADEKISEVRTYVGYQKIAVRLSPPALKKEVPQVYCDLSAIAKGFGVDQVGQYLESLGIADYLVEIGGEIRGRGKNQNNRWWRVGISTPESQPGIQKVVSLKNSAMATSGDYRNYFEEKGIRYSHTIDPATGRPITHKLASVTVIHDSCTFADAVATAINVLGADKGYELALKENLDVLLISRGEDRFIEKMTPGFKKILK